MRWRRRFSHWCEDHFLLAAAVAGLILGAYVAVRAEDPVGGLLAGFIFFAVTAALGWVQYH